MQLGSGFQPPRDPHVCQEASPRGGVRSSLRSAVGEPALVGAWASPPSSCGHATSPQASARTVTERRPEGPAAGSFRHLSRDTQGF